MKTRELLWAATYFYVHKSYGFFADRTRALALDAATNAVQDFDEFFWERDDEDPIATSEAKRKGAWKPKPVGPLASIGHWEITDPDTWEVATSALDTRAEDPSSLPAGWPAQIPGIIAKAAYKTTLAENRELWAAKIGGAQWRLVVEPREDKASVVVWVGTGEVPERFL